MAYVIYMCVYIYIYKYVVWKALFDTCNTHTYRRKTHVDLWRTQRQMHKATAWAGIECVSNYTWNLNKTQTTLNVYMYVHFLIYNLYVCEDSQALHNL